MLKYSKLNCIQHINPLKNEINLVGSKIGSYCTESTLHVHYRAKLLTMFNKIIAILP